MLKFAVPAVAALGLIAFAAQSRATNVEPDAQPAAMPMGWHLSHEGEMAKLAYGVANSDQLALMMTCERGRSYAVAYGDVQPAGPRLTRASMRAVALDPLSGDLAQETRIPLNDPALTNLARKGAMRVEGEAGTFELKATANEQRLIGDFFAYCANRAT